MRSDATINRRQTANRESWLRALIIISAALTSGGATAMELGELKVHSGLGQSLRASLDYRLSPGEMIHESCIGLRPGSRLEGLPAFGPASLSLGDGVIEFTGHTPLTEPMLSATVVVDCPTIPKIARDYLAFLNPHPNPVKSPAVMIGTDPHSPATRSGSWFVEEIAPRSARISFANNTSTETDTGNADLVDTNDKPLGVQRTASAVAESETELAEAPPAWLLWLVAAAMLLVSGIALYRGKPGNRVERRRGGRPAGTHPLRRFDDPRPTPKNNVELNSIAAD